MDDQDFSDPPSHDMSRELLKLRNGVQYQQKLLATIDTRILDNAARLDRVERDQSAMAGLVAGVSQSHVELKEAVDSLNISVRDLRQFSESSAEESEIRHGDAIAMHNQLAELLGKLQLRTLGTNERMIAHTSNEPKLYRWVAGLLVVIGGAVPILIYTAWPIIKNVIRHVSE